MARAKLITQSSSRTERIGSLLKRVLAEGLCDDALLPPSVRTRVAVTRICVSPDLRIADVWVQVGKDWNNSALSDASDTNSDTNIEFCKNVIESLDAHSGALRKRLGSKIRLRRTPQLRFHLDESLEIDYMIDGLLAADKREAPLTS